MEFSPGPDETLEPFLNGSLRILQKKRGYRFSIDAILLSKFICLRKDERAIDLGTGCGILPLLLSKTSPQTHSIVGIEIQKGLADLAGKNVVLNRLEQHVSILRRDFKRLRRDFPPGSFDVVFSNPPYRKYHTGRVNPSLEKAVARHEIKGTLHDLTRLAAYLLPIKGRCYLIYPASRAIDLLVTLRRHQLEPKRLRFVHPKKEGEAKFVLVESIKAGGTELKILRPLFLDQSPLPTP